MFIGTPPPKPLNAKSVSNHCGALLSDLRADPTGEEPGFSCAIFSFVLRDIIETSLCCCSQTDHLSLPPFTIHSRKQKTLLARGRQGVEILVRFFTCSPPDCPDRFRGIARDTLWLPQGQTHNRDLTGYDVSRYFSGPTSSSAKSWLICSCSVSSNVQKD